MIFFLFFYTQIIPPSQLVRVGFDHPDKREEISLGLSPNWHPWWFFFFFFFKLKTWQCSTIHLNWSLKSKLIPTFIVIQLSARDGKDKQMPKIPVSVVWLFFMALCYKLLPFSMTPLDFMMVNHAAALPWIFFFSFRAWSSTPQHFSLKWNH